MTIETSRRLIEAARRLIADDRGGSAFDYAVISAVFAMAVLTTMTLVSNEATNQLASTQARLTNSATLTPQAGG